MNNEFKKSSSGDTTRYVLESGSSGGTSSGSIASVEMPVGGMQRRQGDNLIAQEASKDKVPAEKPRNFVAKNAKMGGAGQHKDKKKAEKQGDVKHKKPFMEGEVVGFPKKHRGDLSDTHECPKCGGDLQGGKYMGHAVKVCQPCKQVYLPPNSGIDQQGNKMAEDHEIQMASSELQSIAKNAEALLHMVQKYSEQEGLEAWQQSKITKAADYLNAVLQSISGEQQDVAETRKANTASARAEFSKRPRKEEPAVQDKKKAESDEAWARLMAYADEKKKKEQGVAEGLESGAKILYTGKDKGGTVTISYEPDYIPGHSEKYIIRFDGKVKSEMPSLRSAVYGLTHYQFDTFRPNLQPNPKTALEQGVAEGSDYMMELAAKLSEKIPKNAPVDVWIKDFAKSNAPQFKGKNLAKRKQMAIAASYGAKNPSKKK